MIIVITPPLLDHAPSRHPFCFGFFFFGGEYLVHAGSLYLCASQLDILEGKVPLRMREQESVSINNAPR